MLRSFGVALSLSSLILLSGCEKLHDNVSIFSKRVAQTDVSANSSFATAASAPQDNYQRANLSGYPDFTSLVDSEGSKVVQITVQVRNSAPDALAELFKQLVPDESEPGDDSEPKKKKPKNKMYNGLGSGFFISNDGYILTNAHVVKEAASVTVRTFGRKKYTAEVVGFDTKTDVALLKIDAPSIPVKIGRPDSLRIGEWVAAIGSPFGFENSVTAGIVSSKKRFLDDSNYLPFIQTDVAINPGNSGGPLLNINGEVVGINTQIYSQSGGYMGMSFALPIDSALQIAEGLKNKKPLSIGRLGIVLETFNDKLAQAMGLSSVDGVVVFSFVPGLPAETSGLLVGDIITAINGQVVSSRSEARSIIAQAGPNAKFDLSVLRGKEPLHIHIVSASEAAPTTVATATVPEPVKKDITPLLDRSFGFALDDNGVVIRILDTGLSGLNVGDKLTQIQFESIKSKDDATQWFVKNRNWKTANMIFKSKKGPIMLIVENGLDDSDDRKPKF